MFVPSLAATGSQVDGAALQAGPETTRPWTTTVIQLGLALTHWRVVSASQAWYTIFVGSSLAPLA